MKTKSTFLLGLVLVSSTLWGVSSRYSLAHEDSIYLHSGATLDFSGKFHVRNGSRRPGRDWQYERREFKKNISWFNTQDFNYFFFEDVCKNRGDSALGTVYTEVINYPQGDLLLIGTLKLLVDDSCTKAMARDALKKRKSFQCYVPPGGNPPKFTLEAKSGDDDTEVKIFKLKNNHPVPSNIVFDPAQCWYVGDMTIQEMHERRMHWGWSN